jgi:C1A family cysteine protease
MAKHCNRTFILLLMLASIGLLLGHTLASSAAHSGRMAIPEIAPLNPAFLESERMQTITTVWHSDSAEPRTTGGYIPSPVDLSHLSTWDGNRLFRSSVHEQDLPGQYDLRKEGRVTPAKDQGNCGACWAFATIGSLESNLLPDEDRDFSENHLKNTSGFVADHCEGGNYFMSMAYLARWSGPVNEIDDPYKDDDDISAEELTAEKHIQSVWVIPDRSAPGTGDNAKIKQVVMDYGAVSTAMYFDSEYYNKYDNAYYYSGSAAANHGILIVGWDDAYPAANFNTYPPGDGAFIIKNNWGQDWGDDGHFYISYHDTVVGKNNFLFNNAEAPYRYDAIYQHDPLGWSGSLGYESSMTAWAANIFTAADHETLSAIGFYAPASNTTYTAYIYTDVGHGPRSGVLAAGPITGGFTFAGYHTVVLPQPIWLEAGENFSIVLEVTTPNYNRPIAIEHPVPGYSAPTANLGESYISANGSDWDDIASINGYDNTNVCIKAFAQSGDADSAPSNTEESNSPDAGAAMSSGGGGCFISSMSINRLCKFTMNYNTGNEYR